MIILRILRLGDEVYGVSLARELSAIRGTDVAVGSVYAALARLELSVRETHEVLSKLWKSVPALVKRDAVCQRPQSTYMREGSSKESSRTQCSIDGICVYVIIC
jgi:hypothetical protein